MAVRLLSILACLVLFAIGPVPEARAQYNVIELPGNVPMTILDGSASYYDAYDSNKPLHLTLVLYDSGFNQGERSAMIAKWLNDNGMKNVTEGKNNLSVEADTDVQTVAAMFGIAIDQYKVGTILYYSNSKPPNIPVELNGVIKKIEGLDNFPPALR